MRPIRIELEGFSTFKERTVIEFGDADLIAFVGPTGSGKSSIIDGMTFALYGSVARYGDARLVAPVIHQGQNEAKVRLDFELAGVRYVAVRVVRRTKTGATTKEARLEQLGDVDDGRVPVLASGAKELTEKVEELLGLDFSQFTRTVVLPQGEFADFLKDEPANRQKLLRRLLDFEVYSRMGSLARDVAKKAAGQAELIEAQLTRYADLTPGLVDEQRSRLGALGSLAETARAGLDEIDRIEERLVALRSAVTTTDHHLAALTAVDVPPAARVASDAMASLRRELEQNRLAVTEARAALAVREAEAAVAGDARDLERQRSAVIRQAELGEELAGLQRDLETASRAAQAAGRELADAEEVAERLHVLLTAARVSSDASSWVSSLEVGAPCPVCRQTVDRVPEHDAEAELGTARLAAEAADQHVGELRHRTAQAANDMARLTARIQDRTRDREDVAELAGSGDAANLGLRIEAAAAAAAKVRTATAAVRAVEAEVVQSEKALVAAESAEREARRSFGTQRDAVAALHPPEPTGESLAEDWSELAAWAEDRLVEVRRERELVAEEGRAAAIVKAERIDQLTRQAETLAVDADPAGLMVAIAAARAATSAEIDRIIERQEEQRSQTEALARLEETRVVHGALGQHLSANGFERWLLTEALDDLVARATVRLLELSSGQYSLIAVDSAFRIIDHRNADEPRDVRTLSGGETFLASLSLALALADSIGELAPADAPRLGSMFLDEGFGTLDAETLDVVATAIEELSSSGRLVGIVTHIEALAERMPVRVVVVKGPSGSSVRVEAS